MAGPGSLWIKGAIVVDTRTGGLTPDTDVIVEKGVIQQVRPSGSGDQVSGMPTLEAQGKFLTPGFLDMHVHSMQQKNPSENLALMLAHGITGIRQMAGSEELLQKRRDGLLDLGPESPELLAMPGAILTAGNAATPEAAVAEVKRQKQQGADFIKTIFCLAQSFLRVARRGKTAGSSLWWTCVARRRYRQGIETRDELHRAPRPDGAVIDSLLQRGAYHSNHSCAQATCPRQPVGGGDEGKEGADADRQSKPLSPADGLEGNGEDQAAGLLL